MKKRIPDRELTKGGLPRQNAGAAKKAIYWISRELYNIQNMEFDSVDKMKIELSRVKNEVDTNLTPQFNKFHAVLKSKKARVKFLTKRIAHLNKLLEGKGVEIKDKNTWDWSKEQV